MDLDLPTLRMSGVFCVSQRPHFEPRVYYIIVYIDVLMCIISELDIPKM